MAHYGLSQLNNLQDKTTIKGRYLFFIFSLISLIYIKLNLINFEIFLNSLTFLNQFIILIGISSLITAFFYYIKITDLIFKFLLDIKFKFSKYQKYYNVNLYETIEAILLLEADR